MDSCIAITKFITLNVCHNVMFNKRRKLDYTHDRYNEPTLFDPMEIKGFNLCIYSNGMKIYTKQIKAT